MSETTGLPSVLDVLGLMSSGSDEYDEMDNQNAAEDIVALFEAAVPRIKAEALREFRDELTKWVELSDDSAPFRVTVSQVLDLYADRIEAGR